MYRHYLGGERFENSAIYSVGPLGVPVLEILDHAKYLVLVLWGPDLNWIISHIMGVYLR